MNMARTLKAPNDRTTNRLIVGSILILVIGIPLVGILYFFDQYRDAGPSLPDRAIQAAEEAVRANPNSVNARFALAEYYAGQGRYAEAITQYDEILKAQPDTAAVLLGRGRAQLALDNLDAATADFQRVVDTGKDAEMAHVDPQLEAAYYNLGAIALKRGQPRDAVALLTDAIRINSTDADALYLIGVALTQSGDPATAIDALRSAIALVPSGWCEPYAQLGLAYTAQKDAAGAQYANGMVAYCSNQPEDAKAELQPLTSGAYATDALVGLGLVAEGQGDNVAAADAYRKVLAKDPKNFSAMTGLGRVGGSAVDAALPSPSSAEGN